MTLRAQISRVLSAVITSPTLRAAVRRRARLARVLSRRAPELHYFHQADDPYSALAAQCLPALEERYGARIVAHLVPPPDDAAAPERDRLRAYGVRDAVRVARRYRLSFPAGATLPSSDAVRAASAQLAQALADGEFPGRAVRIGEALWSGAIIEAPSADDAATARALEEGGALRARLGHYLGGMFHFEGEWYWGVDRLHHLETRLRNERLVRDPGSPRVAPFQDMTLDGTSGPRSPLIEFWFSFRSPYSWIAAPRVHRLAAHYGAQVRWRFILPMIMRGLPVPTIKSRYIMFDVKREAETLGLPFGTSVDPAGRGIHRALAVLHRAIPLGKGAAFVESGLKAAFADGIDLASEPGLRVAAARAGLTDHDVRAALADESWRVVAEDNRQALFEAGLWGAPTYRVDGMPAHWGQDRLWTLEEDLKTAIAGAGRSS
jgi:2-hydroxychromene-2-carboxylate isomerase